MAVAVVSISGLTAVGIAALVAVQQTSRTTAHSRFQSAALYAAESGIAAGQDFLRNNFHATNNWSDYVTPNNQDPYIPSQVLVQGNGVRVGESGSPFSGDLDVWYEVSLLNNITDPDFVAGSDADRTVILRSIGHGPGNSSITIEVQVTSKDFEPGAVNMCNEGYCQGFGNAMNNAVSGINNIDTSVVNTTTIGGS